MLQEIYRERLVKSIFGKVPKGLPCKGDTVAIPHVKAVTATNIAQYYEEDTIGARSHGVPKQNIQHG